MPRSGSTLLLQVLGQNPKHHVTPTSGLIDLFGFIQQNWRRSQAFHSEGLEKVLPRIRNSMKGLLHGYYKEELDNDIVVFDKNRGWLNHYEEVRVCLDYMPKMIVMVRPVLEVVASFEKIYRNRDVDYIHPQNEAYVQHQTVHGRVAQWLAPGGVAGMAIARVRDVIQRDLPSEALCVLPYNMLVNRPQETLELVHEFLGLEPYEYNFEKVEQLTHEDDVYHGMKLHVIKPKVTPAEKKPWDDLFPADIIEQINTQYADIEKLCPDVPIESNKPTETTKNTKKSSRKR